MFETRELALTDSTLNYRHCRIGKQNERVDHRPMHHSYFYVVEIGPTIGAHNRGRHNRYRSLSHSVSDSVMSWTRGWPSDLVDLESLNYGPWRCGVSGAADWSANSLAEFLFPISFRLLL